MSSACTAVMHALMFLLKIVLEPGNNARKLSKENRGWLEEPLQQVRIRGRRAPIAAEVGRGQRGEGGGELFLEHAT